MPTPTTPTNALSKVCKGGAAGVPPPTAERFATLRLIRRALEAVREAGALQVPELLGLLGLEPGDWYVRQDGWLLAWGMPEQLGEVVHALLSSGCLVVRPCAPWVLRVAGVCPPADADVLPCLLALPREKDGKGHRRCGKARCRVCRLLWDAQGATQVAKADPWHAEEAQAKWAWARRNEGRLRRRRRPQPEPEPEPQPEPEPAYEATEAYEPAADWRPTYPWRLSKNGNWCRPLGDGRWVTVFEGRHAAGWHFVVDSKYSRAYRTRADALHAAEDAIAQEDVA
jgi:hypothetical protein